MDQELAQCVQCNANFVQIAHFALNVLLDIFGKMEHLKDFVYSNVLALDLF